MYSRQYKLQSIYEFWCEDITSPPLIYLIYCYPHFFMYNIECDVIFDLVYLCVTCVYNNVLNFCVVAFIYVFLHT